MTTDTLTAHGHDAHHHEHHDMDKTDVFGFWIYIMSDCVLFATLFATFIVLRHNTFGGATMKDITSLPYVLVETIFLLTSSFTFGLATLNLYKGGRGRVIGWLVITFIFGIAFVLMEIHEFVGLIHEGHGPQSSAAMSAFFTLVGTHGFHVSMGLLWMIIVMVQLFMYGNSKTMQRRMTYLGLFWAFLDIVWIFVFTIVYLMGVV